MTKIAIVGTSNIYNNVERVDIKLKCKEIIERFSKDTIIISGGAEGVDSIAAEIARTLGYKVHEYVPENDTWEPNGYKIRNERIVNNCDQLFCISIPVHIQKCYHHKTPQEHEKTAGCWTLNRARHIGKSTEFFKV